MLKVWNKRDPNCPKDAVYVGRPSKWGNPFKIGEWDFATHKIMTRSKTIEKYRLWIESNSELSQDLYKLKGKDLVCWCAPLSCHADVLLELANNKAMTTYTSPFRSCDHPDCDRDIDVQCEHCGSHFCARHIAEHLKKEHGVE